MNYTELLVKVLYLLGTILFIYGIKNMGHPDTARRGNFIGAVGMAIGILVILFVPISNAQNPIGALVIIFLALALGSAVGYVASVKVPLTAMPEMVSLFNGFGGGCSMLIGFTEMYKVSQGGAAITVAGVITGVFAIFVGSITLSGSVVAWGKLSGALRDKIKLPFPQIINLLVLAVNVFLGYTIIAQGPNSIGMLALLMVASLVYGFTFVTPIGGGDMPVVISLLNSFSGIAASISGLLYNNNFMVVGGILVGSSGTILTILMCKAMNRSLLNVIIGGFGSSGSSVEGAEGKSIQEVSLGDLAIQLKYAGQVVVVPGYGLAVAQAQHACHDLEKVLSAGGVQVTYAIHPVAGRMPGHMNVLLAEAQVPYEKLLELEPANEQFPSTDVVLVIGANDVVNPAAQDSPGSPIYGMPILDVKLAKTVVVLKRSMRAGYAGVENPLFFKDNTRMLFGDAKDSLTKLKAEIASI